MNTLAVFLKYPAPGKVKTRMAKDLGEKRAAEIYSAMAETVIKTAFESASENQEVSIFYDPPEMRGEIQNWLDGTGVLNENFERRLFPQRGKSLGEKISNAIGSCLRTGSEKVCVIGTDCVEIDSAVIAEAFERLDSADAVIGPCEDGGYYLIGLKRSLPEIFSGIEWSAEKVTVQTLEKIRRLSLKASVMKTLRDIDSAGDLTEKVFRAIGRPQKNPAEKFRGFQNRRRRADGR